MWRPDEWQMPMFEPAVVAIKDFTNSSPSQGLLMHIFSNGGSYTAVQLAQAYRQSISSSSGKALDLPVAAIVFDSCPSPPRFQLGIKALAMGLPKTMLAQWFGLAGIYLALGQMALLHQFGIVELFLAKAHRELNGVGGPFLQRGVPRAYVYSQSDAAAGGYCGTCTSSSSVTRPEGW
jgi:Eukaryotic protein of unknown function (DUF829)